jgi:hypothetical protein
MKRLLSFILLLVISSVRIFAQQPGTSQYPTSPDTSLTLMEVANRANSTLSVVLTNVATTLTVTSAVLFPSSGAVSIDDEIIYFTGKSGNDLTGLLRGRDGTSAASHALNSVVSMRVTARHHKVLADAIIAMQTKYPGSLTGILYSSGTNPVAAVTIGSGLSFSGGTLSNTNSGTVTSVAVSVPSFLSVSGSPITGSGTVAISLSGTALPIANGGTGSTTQNFIDLTNPQTVTGLKTFGSGTNYDETGSASQGSTAQGLKVAVGSSGTPNSTNTPVVSFQKVSSVNLAFGASEIPFLHSATKKSGGGNIYLNHNFIRQESATLTDSVAVTGSVFADPVGFPNQPSTSASTSGGSLATGTYYYKVTAIIGSVETIASWEKSQAVTGPTGSVTVSWSAVSGASSYKVYRSTTTESQDVRIKTTSSTSYVDDGTAPEASATPPAQTNWCSWNIGNRTGPVRLSGAEFGISTTTSFSAGRNSNSTNATFGLNIVGTGNATTSTALNHTAGIIFQAGAPFGKFYDGIRFSANTVEDQAINFSELGSSIPATLHANLQYNTWYNASGVAKRLVTLNASNNWNFDPDAQGSVFNAYTSYGTNTIGTFSDTLTAGWRILLYNGGAGVRYGLGVESGFQWYGSSGGHKFYVGASNVPVAALSIANGGVTTFNFAPVVSIDNATTAAVDDFLTLTHTSSGTPAASFGAGLLTQLESSTSTRDASRIATIWTDVTDASRKSALTFQTTNSGTMTEVLRLDYTNGNSFNAAGTPAIFTRTLGASIGIPQGTAQFGLAGFNSAVNDGASMLFFAPDNGGVKAFTGRVSGVVETSSGGAVGSGGLFAAGIVVSVRLNAGDATAVTEAGRFSPTEGMRLAAEFPLTFNESSNTPGNPTSSNQARLYVKGDKLIIQFNDAGTVRWKYLDLTGTGVTWTHTTSAP